MGPIVRYTFLGFQLLGRIDEGESIPIDAVWEVEHDEGSYFTLLEESFGSRIDLSLYDDPLVREEIDDKFRRCANAISPNKFTLPGNNGLVYLAALCFEALQNPEPEAE
jgi:hypothetical protein